MAGRGLISLCCDLLSANDLADDVGASHDTNRIETSIWGRIRERGNRHNASFVDTIRPGNPTW